MESHLDSKSVPPVSLLCSPNFRPRAEQPAHPALRLPLPLSTVQIVVTLIQALRGLLWVRQFALASIIEILHEYTFLWCTHYL